MFRVKVTVTLSLIIVGLTLLVYVLLPPVLEAEIVRNAEEGLEVAASSLERAERLDDFALVAKAEQVAEFQGLKTSLTDEYPGNYEYQRHLGVYNGGLLRWKFVFENLQKDKDAVREIELPLEERRPFLPDLFFVTDEMGNGVAALGKGRYDWYNVNVAKQHPVLLKAQLGRPIKDVWIWRWSQSDNDDLYRVAVAPVMQGSEKMIGVVVVGNLINDGAAGLASASMEGNGVAYFHQGTIFASTLKPDDDEALAGQLFNEQKLLEQGSEPEVTRVKLDDGEHLALLRYHSSNASDARSGFIVLRNLSDELAVVQQVRTGILVIGLLLLLLTVGTVFVFLQLYIRAFEEIDRGIQEVLAGNRDYEFKVRGNYAFQRDMARSLNLMSAFLQGKTMPDEEEEAAPDWGDLMVDEVSATSMMRAIHREKLLEEGKPVVKGVALPGMPPPVAAPVATEPAPNREEADRKLYDEYLTAKKNLGEDISDLDYDGFIKRLTKNREALKKKHNARDIEFSVVVREGKVVLKPEPVL